MSTTEAAPMDFSQFGHAFAELVLVPEVIGPRLEALLPSEIKVTEDIAIVRATVRGAATVGSIEELELEVDELSTLRRHRAWVDINLSLRLGMKLTREDYAVSGTFPIILTSRVEEPLSLVVDVDPPEHSDIEVTVSGGGRLNLAKKVGGLDGRVRDHVVRIVEEMVDQTEMHRRFDVVALVHAALAGMDGDGQAGGGVYDLTVETELDLDEASGRDPELDAVEAEA
ncbi:MAG: hypothetical protein R2754_01140 [Microthrixaceae bacterium]